MSCPKVSQSAEYPSYLKSILSEVENSDDENLKSCACSLIPVIDDCKNLILDKNGKMAAFPFCIQKYDSLNSVPRAQCFTNGSSGFPEPVEGVTVPFKNVAQKVPLDEIMRLYWTVKEVEINFNGEKIEKESYKRDIDKKELVCGHYDWDGKTYDRKVLCDSPPFNGSEYVPSEAGQAGCYNHEAIDVAIRLYFGDGVSRVVMIKNENDYSFYIRKPFIRYYKSFSTNISCDQAISIFNSGGDCESDSFWACPDEYPENWTNPNGCGAFDTIRYNYGFIKIDEGYSSSRNNIQIGFCTPEGEPAYKKVSGHGVDITFKYF